MINIPSEQLQLFKKQTVLYYMKDNYISTIVPKHLEYIETILRELYALDYIGISNDN